MDFGILRVVYTADTRNVERAASQVDRINRQTARNAEQNDRLLERSAKTLADVRVREGRRAANEIIRDLERERRARQDAERNSGAGGIGGELLALGRVGGLSAIAAGFLSAGKAGIEYANTLEKLQRSFAGLLGSTQAAQAHLKELQQFAARTPFEFEEVARASQRFVAMGLSARDTVPYLTAIGNAVAKVGGGSDEIDRVSLAIAQISARGKVSAQEMNQLANAMIDGWKPLEAELGKTRGELFKMAEAGQISADTFLRAFRKAHEGSDAMARQMTTLSGAASTLKDNTKLLLAQAFDPLYRQLTNLTVGAAAFTSELTQSSAAGQQAALTWKDALAAFVAYKAILGGQSAADRDFRNQRLNSGPQASGAGIGSVISEAGVEARQAEINKWIDESVRQWSAMEKALAPARESLRALQSQLRTLGDDSTTTAVREKFRQLREELERSPTVPDGWEAKLADLERQELKIAEAIDARRKALETAQKAERDRDRTLETTRDGLRRALIEVQNFGLSESEAAVNTLRWTTGLRDLNDATKQLSLDKLIEATSVFVGQRTILDELSGQRSEYINSLGYEATGLERVNRAMADYVKRGGVLTEQIITLATHAKEVARIADALRIINEIEPPTGIQFEPRPPEINPPSGPTIYAGEAPRNIYLDRVRHRQLMLEIADDITSIIGGSLRDLQGDWSNVWRSMLFEALDVVRRIADELLRLSLEVLLTGSTSGSNAGGILGSIVNSVGGALFGNILGAAPGGAGAGAAGAANRFLGGFAMGGAFTVGGAGGTDSQYVSFLATPGERVEITRPGQQGGAGGNTYNYYTITTPAPRSASYVQRRASREVAETIAATLRTRG